MPPRRSASSTPAPHDAARPADPTLRRTHITHLRRIEGQVRGLIAMVEQDRPCADLITQVAAVRESLLSVAKSVMRNHLRHCAATALSGPPTQREPMVEEILDLVAKVSRG